MTAHIVFEALDGERPASMSAAVVRGLLRERLGFAGVVVTDDLEMKAIADHFAIEEVAVNALAAGVDVLLVCHTAELARRAVAAIVHAVRSGAVSEEILKCALERVSAFGARFARPPLDVPELAAIGSERHRALVERVLAAAEART